MSTGITILITLIVLFAVPIPREADGSFTTEGYVVVGSALAVLIFIWTRK
jgi:hypothetical protein